MGPGPAPGWHGWLGLSTLLLVQPGHSMVSAYSSHLFQARGAGFPLSTVRLAMAGILSLLMTFLHPGLLDTLPPFYMFVWGCKFFLKDRVLLLYVHFLYCFQVVSERRVKVILQTGVSVFF